MAVAWERTLPTKRELGIGYLTGAGLAVALSLLGYLWFTRESVVVAAVGTTITLSLFATIIYIGYLFLEIDPSGQFVWNVARWAALGLGLAALLSLGIATSPRNFPVSTLVPSLLVVTIAAGGVIGTLLGVVAGLREQHRRMREVTQRNKVMNRVLRHNIRNAMNVVHGRASLLTEEADLGGDQSIEVIKRTANEVHSLSEAARKIDDLSTLSERGPVDTVRLVEEYLKTARETYPDAEFTADLPASAWADAGPLVRAALANLVENAVEHNDRPPEIHVSIREDEAGDRVDISVADNGSGIPDSQIDVLYREREVSTHHGNGLGLWFVKWLVDYHDGDLRFEENEPHGAVVHLRLPAADPPADGESNWPSSIG